MIGIIEYMSYKEKEGAKEEPILYKENVIFRENDSAKEDLYILTLEQSKHKGNEYITVYGYDFSKVNTGLPSARKIRGAFATAEQ